MTQIRPEQIAYTATSFHYGVNQKT